MQIRRTFYLVTFVDAFLGFFCHGPILEKDGLGYEPSVTGLD